MRKLKNSPLFKRFFEKNGNGTSYRVQIFTELFFLVILKKNAWRLIFWRIFQENSILNKFEPPYCTQYTEIYVQLFIYTNCAAVSSNINYSYRFLIRNTHSTVSFREYNSPALYKY